MLLARRYHPHIEIKIKMCSHLPSELYTDQMFSVKQKHTVIWLSLNIIGREACSYVDFLSLYARISYFCFLKGPSG